MTPVPWTWVGGELRGAAPTLQERLGVLGGCLAAGVCPSASAPCEAHNCARHDVEVPEGTGALVAGLRWPSVEPLWMALWIEDAQGSVVAQGRSTTIDHNGASAILDEPAPGLYRIGVAAMWGIGNYEAGARIVPRTEPTQVRDLLPDIVTLPPTDLRFEDPPGHFFMNAIVLQTNPVAHAMGARHCSMDEAMVGARLCLRFTNAVGNVGEGPLHVALSAQDGATHMAGGRFVQRILASDGSWRETPAGVAEFHTIHGHWHNAGSNEFRVYAYDVASGTRGEAVAEGRKTGMCFADVGVLEPAWPGLALPAHGGVQCFNPTLTREWSMGLSVGWYDAYTWHLNDQYVEMTGVEDGDYLLCSLANGDGTLQEIDLENNEGCTAFRLEGTAIETLDPLPYHAGP